MNYRYSSPPFEHFVLNSPPLPDYDGHPVGEWRKDCPLCPPNPAPGPSDLVERLRRFADNTRWHEHDQLGREAADRLLSNSIKIEGLRKRVADLEQQLRPYLKSDEETRIARRRHRDELAAERQDKGPQRSERD